MPRLRVVRDLKTICLISVARNMDNLWCADLIRNPNPAYSYVIGPFEYLTSDLMQCLLNILSEMNQLKRVYLPLLINNHVTSLDLTPWFKHNINTTTIYNVIKARCQRLTHLKLNHPRIPANFAHSILEFLPNLVSLDLSLSSCTDDNLANVSSICRKLRVLKLAFCSAISDLGVQKLCDGSCDLTCSIASPSHVCSCKIAHLDLSYTSVSDDGVQAALKRLVHLQHLECTDISMPLYKIMEDHFTFNTPLRTFPLKLLNVEIDVDRELVVDYIAVIGATCTMCPTAVEVRVTGRAANQSVVVLSQLENLRTLHVHSVPGQPVCFQAGLMTLFQIHGSVLTTLNLHDVNGLDFELIAFCCPYLVSLSCAVTPATKHPYTVGGCVASNSEDFRPFPALEYIEINQVEAIAQCPAHFISLALAHSLSIKVVKLVGLEKLSDEILDEIMTTNPLRHLEVLSFTNCPTVTFAPVRNILALPNELIRLDLCNCFEMSRNEYESCKKLIAGRNYDLVFQWE